MFTGKRSKFLVALLVLSLLVALVPAGVVSAAKCDITYEVRRGDTLAKIGDRYGYAANQIVDVNHMNKPYTIYVGQRICIPTKTNKDAPKLDSKYAKAPAAFFTAGRTSDSLLIYTYTYPSTTVLIKGADASDSSRTFYKIGTLATKNNKSFKYKLPSELKNAGPLLICLKDRTTSYLQCVTTR